VNLRRYSTTSWVIFWSINLRKLQSLLKAQSLLKPSVTSKSFSHSWRLSAWPFFLLHNRQTSIKSTSKFNHRLQQKLFSSPHSHFPPSIHVFNFSFLHLSDYTKLAFNWMKPLTYFRNIKKPFHKNPTTKNSLFHSLIARIKLKKWGINSKHRNCIAQLQMERKNFSQIRARINKKAVSVNCLFL
jgi:hypothetical protein